MAGSTPATVTAPRFATVASNQIQRVITGIILIPAVLGIIIFAPPMVFGAIAAVLAVLVAREYLDLAHKYGLEPHDLATYAFVALAVIWPMWAIPVPYEPLLMMLALILAMRPERSLEKSLTGSASTVLGVLYTGLPFALLVALRLSPRGVALVLYVLILTWIGDTAAYYAGRSLGRHKLAPRISPGKTWEGTVASLVASMVLGYFAMAHFVPAVPVWLSLFTAALVNVAGQLGDLAESALKRGAGVKDSGALLPGHGGALDRVDALLFAIPAMWYDIEILLRPYLSL